MQQYLPFTVLKPLPCSSVPLTTTSAVATVLTVYGIETHEVKIFNTIGVEVATVLTVYGIETECLILKVAAIRGLQQYLPFTVLKQANTPASRMKKFLVATVLTVYGIETFF